LTRFLIALWLIFLTGPALAQDEQERDRSLIVGFIEDALSDGAARSVRIDGFSGALSSTATLERLTVADADGVWLTIENAELNWNRSALFAGQVDITRLAAERIALERLPVSEGGDMPPPEAVPFSLPDLPVSIRIGELQVDRIELGAPLLGFEVLASASGSVSLAGGEGTAALDLTRLDGPEGVFALAASYSNETGVLDLNLELTEDAGGIAATLLDIPETPSVELAVEGSGPLNDFAADITLATDGEPRLSGDVTLSQSDAGARQLAVDLSGDVARLLAPDYQPFFGNAVSLQALAITAPDGAMVLDRFEITTASLSVSGSGALDPSGTPERFSLTMLMRPAEGDLVRLPIPGQRVEAASADISLSYDRTAGDSWQGQASLIDLRLDTMRLDEAQLDMSGTILTPDNTLEGVTAEVAASFEGLTLEDDALQQAVGPAGQAGFDLVWSDGDPVEITDLTLSTRNAQLSGSADFTTPEEQLMLALQLEGMLPDLSAFSALAGSDLEGAVAVELRGAVELLSGAFDLRVDGTGQEIALGVGEPEGLLAGETVISALAIRDEDGLRIDNLRVEGQEITASGSVALASDASRVQFDAALREAGLINPALSGPLTLAAALERGASDTPWDVEAEAQLPNIAVTLAGQVGQPDGGFDLRLDGVGQDLELGLGEPEGLLAGETVLSARAVQDADGLRIEDLQVEGQQITASGSASIAPEASRVQLDARLRNAGLISSSISGPLTVAATLERGASDTPWNLEAEARLQNIAVNARGQVGLPDGAVDLRVTGNAALALVNPFIAPRSVQGMANLDLRIQGQPGLPAVSGTISANGLRVAAPNLGLALENLSANVQLSGGRASVSGQGALSTGGNVNLDGSVDLTGPGLPGNIDVTLTQARIVQGDFLQTVVTRGDISISGRLTQGPTISGQIDLGQTDIVLTNSTTGAAEPIPDIRHVNEDRDSRIARANAGLIGQGGGGASGPPLPLDLTISAPNRIFVRGSGLDAEMGGAIRIGGTTANVIPSGQFELIRGRLSVVGQRFDLIEGSVTLQGSFDPYLRVVAQTEAGDVLARIIVEGPISNPELTLTSTPSLPEDEILSRLLFGREASSLSAVQALQLVDGLSRLAGSGSVIGGIRDSLGVDDLDLTTDAEGNAQVRLGRYIGENAYTDVQIGSDGEAEASINLDLTPNITARGSFSSDGQSGIGVFFERDY